MPTTPPPEGAARSAEAVQAEIRALMQETGGWLWGPTRQRYEQLRDEWVAAVRGEMTTAA
ncbi:polyhydroxyalkanoate synthesis regulator phasin [Streptomyces glaucescens]